MKKLSVSLRQPITIGAIAFVVLFLFSSGTFLARAVEQDELRPVREEIFNLRQQLLELRVFWTREKFERDANLIGLGTEGDAQRRALACAEVKDQLQAFDLVWTKIREFWPLGQEKLEALEDFRKMYSEYCAEANQ
jgi:anaerobic glycerol-3-phosphate dehydrogenase